MPGHGRHALLLTAVAAAVAAAVGAPLVSVAAHGSDTARPAYASAARPAYAAPASPTATTALPTLRYGSRGPAVVRLQRRLTYLRYDVGPVDGVFGYSTLHGVVAFQKVQRIARDGVVGPVTWGRLAAPYRPGARYWHSGSGLEVNLARQVVYLTRRGAVLRILDSSTGNGKRYYANGGWHYAITPTGRFHVTWRVDGWRYSSSGLGWMWRPNYFYAGYAVHGSTSVPPYPASHGCVRVTIPAMNRLWPALWIGMPVGVYRP